MKCVQYTLSTKSKVVSTIAAANVVLELKRLEKAGKISRFNTSYEEPNYLNIWFDEEKQISVFLMISENLAFFKDPQVVERTFEQLYFTKIDFD